MSTGNSERTLLDHYQKAGNEPPVMEKTYLSTNVLARMLWQRRAWEIFKIVLPLISGGKTVLDIGRGGGWYSKRFAEAGARVISSDISRGYLRQTLDYCRDMDSVAVLQCDAGQLPFADESVDIVLISEVLEHLISPEKAITDIKRVFKNNGTVLMTVPSILNIELAARLSAKLKGQFYEHLHSYTPWSFRRFARKNGLRVLTLKTALFLPIPWGRLHTRVNATEKVYNFIENILTVIPGLHLFGRTIIITAQVERDR